MPAILKKLRKLASILGVSAYRAALVQERVAAGVEHEPMLRNLECRTVVDIGANRGQFALAARRCFPEARIVSFEPLPGPARLFRRVFDGDGAVVLHEAAIGPSETGAVMHVSAADDSSSLLPIAPLQSEIFPGTGEAGTTEVRVAPLESFVPPDEIRAPALLKLDVQGFEYEALLGCESLLPRFDSIYCECSFMELYSGQRLAADVIAWLEGRGFRLCGVYNAAYDFRGRAVQADFLFKRS